MNIVDSSGWLEYFSGGANAGLFENALKDYDSLVVPVITTYEVFKVVLRERNENHAIAAVAAMKRGNIIEITIELSLSAARLSFETGLSMADSFILATARLTQAEIWTQDADFKGFPGVKFIPKK